MTAGFTNNIGAHEKCRKCGKPIHQHGDPAIWPGDHHYCECAQDDAEKEA